MSVSGIIADALCAWWDWADRFEEAHPTAVVGGLVALSVVGYAIVGTLE